MLAVFSLSLFVDVCWTRYNLAVANPFPQPVRAGLWSSAIILCGSISTWIWLDNRWTLAASMIGGFIGTWWAVRTAAK